MREKNGSGMRNDRLFMAGCGIDILRRERDLPILTRGMQECLAGRAMKKENMYVIG